MSESLFRAAALKKLSTPEDLDRMINVTKPVGWAAGLAMAALIAGVLVWSVVGRLPSRVVGTGLVLPQGGRIIELQSRGSGVVTSVQVAVGDVVEVGQIVARLGETEGQRELGALQAQLADRDRDRTQAQTNNDVERQARLESVRRQRDALELRIQNARSQEVTLRERVATNDILYRDRLITRGQVVQTQNELATTRQELSNATSDSARLGADELDLRRSAEERLAERDRQIFQLRQQIKTLTANLDAQLVVRSPDAGRVLEVRTQPGALVRAGQALLEVEQRGTGYEIVAFVSSQNGKRVKSGMSVRAALASVRREESGMLLGTVASVSDFPISFEALRALIQNEDLARSFTQNGPPFMVRVALVLDTGSVSGYRWTSQRGDAVPITSGIPVSAEIVTELRRPIGMVIPALREMLGS